MEHLRIDSPCPILLSRMKQQDGSGHFCKSCSKSLVDFRGCSSKEIQATLKPGTCGIFNADQLPAQRQMPFMRHVLFYSLTLLSFIGFNVKPLSAQNVQPADSLQVKRTEQSVKEKPDKKDRAAIRRQKKEAATKPRKRVVMGCPEF